MTSQELNKTINEKVETINKLNEQFTKLNETILEQDKIIQEQKLLEQTANNKQQNIILTRLKTYFSWLTSNKRRKRILTKQIKSFCAWRNGKEAKLEIKQNEELIQDLEMTKQYLDNTIQEIEDLNQDQDL